VLNSLNVAHTGLTAARVSVENISNNIANENTPGYKKRVLQLSEMAQMDSQFVGRGVSIGNSYRVTSQYMYDKLLSENSKSNYNEKLTNMLSSVEAVFSETTNSGFSNDLSSYFQSVENLRSNPNSLVYRNELKSKGTILADSLSNLYTAVQKQQSDEKDELKTNIIRVNDIIKEIGSINEKIQKYDSSNLELLDKRDLLESELSNYVDISSTNKDNEYELKISGVTVISNNTNVRSVDLMEENTYQIDRFRNSDGTSNIKLSSGSFDTNDKITYKLNNEYEVSVQIGENIDLDGDGTKETAIDANNIIRALAHKINTTTGISDYVTAYNGDSLLGYSGTGDNYLRIVSKFPGETNSFEGRISIEEIDDAVGSTVVEKRSTIGKNDNESDTAQSTVALGLYDTKVNVKNGILKAQLENMSTDSTMNKYQTYLDKLDAFAKTLSDITDKYSVDSSGKYIYGEMASDSQNGTINSLGLFSGSSVKTLKFNSSSVNDLTQTGLDYLATIQWKNDLNFEGKAQGTASNDSYSLSHFYNSIKIEVSSDNEDVINAKDVQDAIKQSIQTSYDQLTKVDKDEEMLNLITFQAAYTANAKIVTAIDDMLQTLLGMKR
jgi:flagellar hook-associated protein 1